MPTPAVNDPSRYYATDASPSLAWEMTICECLSSRGSPYLEAMREPKPYGEAVGRFVQARLGLSAGSSVLEVGGGYGTLMAAFLDVIPARDVTLVDVSPFLLAEQRRALASRPQCSFVEADALSFLGSCDREWDLVVSNENLGDLRAYTDLPREEVAAALADPARLRDGAGDDDLIASAARKFARYGLPLPDGPAFHFNYGAIEYLESLAPRARAVFLSEHGADTVLPKPYSEFVSCEGSTGLPRRISLKGHDEYSIHFGFLERVARKLGYQVCRFHMMEFLGLRHDEGVRFMVRAASTRSEKAELMQEFFLHAAEYQCMLLVRERGPA